MELKSPLTPEQILAKKKAFQIPCTYHFYQRPPHLVRGQMQYVWDSGGRRYLDAFAGVSVVACGHANPAIVEATIAQLQRLQHTTSIYLTQPVVDLAERLAQILPGDLNRSFFCNSGSEANEMAFLLARVATGRRRIVSLVRGLHGRTYQGMSATGLDLWRTDPFPDPDFVQVANPFDVGEVAALAALEAELARGDVAAVIVEPIQGNGGIVPLSSSYLQALRRQTEARGSLLILDEIQTGFGRTGRWFGFEESGILPDIVSLAKALGNGVPIAAVTAVESVAAKLTRPSASTLGGNPVSCATALAVLDYLEANRLPERAAALGARLGAGLSDLALRFPFLASPRGRGLMWGLEVRNPSGEPSGERTDAILEHAKDRGLLVGKNGPHRNVLAIQPPLVLDESDVEFLVTTLGEAVKLSAG
ncbi:MAG TPA: aspartate aminotransferase family protein [Spirochaetia bacterium]|nr:aspartate aminotransferase family protein [Spirochaetia bacterium]